MILHDKAEFLDEREISFLTWVALTLHSHSDLQRERDDTEVVERGLLVKESCHQWRESLSLYTLTLTFSGREMILKWSNGVYW
jgi:hypothetical protein